MSQGGAYARAAKLRLRLIKGEGANRAQESVHLAAGFYYTGAPDPHSILGSNGDDTLKRAAAVTTPPSAVAGRLLGRAAWGRTSLTVVMANPATTLTFGGPGLDSLISAHGNEVISGLAS